MNGTKIDITYAELRDDDVLIDKSGGRWHVSGVENMRSEPPSRRFWLGDPRTKVRLHHMTKPAGDSCTVERIATHADEVAALENPWPTPDEPTVTHDEAVAAVEAIGGEVVVEQTAAEVDAVRRATEDEPVVLPLFESMTDLEQRSHMFVLHGIFAHDVEDRIERSKMHARAHTDRAQGKIKSRHTPHVHSEEASA